MLLRNDRPGTAARFILVGGFLGAGKTTALVRLARRYADAGLRVGMITNDQAPDLVDTASLRVRGFRVEEVAGGCFCCRFDDLARAADRLRAEDRPQVLLAEPVGSCTDLVATVINPLKKMYGNDYVLAPYSALLDPVRAEQMLVGRGCGGFSSKVAYIFRKQLEEADAVLLNKVDLLNEGRKAAILGALDREFPGKRRLCLSAQTGVGYEAWGAFLEERGAFGRNILEIDYDLYAEGEAEMGWLNAVASVKGPVAFGPDQVVLELVLALQRKLESARAEPAHLKVLFREDAGSAAVANLVGSGEAPVLSRSLPRPSRSGDLTINARVHADPAVLREAVESALKEIAASRDLSFRVHQIASFRPSRPVPAHRYDRPVL